MIENTFIQIDMHYVKNKSLNEKVLDFDDEVIEIGDDDNLQDQESEYPENTSQRNSDSSQEVIEIGDIEEPAPAASINQSPANNAPKYPLNTARSSSSKWDDLDVDADDAFGNDALDVLNTVSDESFEKSVKTEKFFDTYGDEIRKSYNEYIDGINKMMSSMLRKTVVTKSTVFDNELSVNDALYEPLSANDENDNQKMSVALYVASKFKHNISPIVDSDPKNEKLVVMPDNLLFNETKMTPYSYRCPEDVNIKLYNFYNYWHILIPETINLLVNPFILKMGKYSYDYIKTLNEFLKCMHKNFVNVEIGNIYKFDDTAIRIDHLIFNDKHPVDEIDYEYAWHMIMIASKISTLPNTLKVCYGLTKSEYRFYASFETMFKFFSGISKKFYSSSHASAKLPNSKIWAAECADWEFEGDKEKHIVTLKKK